MLSYPFAESPAPVEGPDTLEAPDAPEAISAGRSGPAADGEGPAYTFEGFEIDSSVRIMLTPLGGGGGAGPTIVPAPRK